MTEFFLIVFSLLVIIILFTTTLNVINQLFIEKRNQQLENYKASFKEVPKLLKVKVVFQEGSNTLSLPNDASDAKLTTVFINAPKGTRITFSPAPGQPADTYEKIAESGGLSGKNPVNTRIYFSSISFAGEHWTKNGTLINDADMNKILIPKGVQIKVDAPKSFNINIEKPIQTINVELAKEVSSIATETTTISDVSIVAKTYDTTGSVVGEKVIDASTQEITNQTIKEVVSNDLNETTTVQPTPIQTPPTIVIDLRSHCCIECIDQYNSLVRNSTTTAVIQTNCLNLVRFELAEGSSTTVTGSTTSTTNDLAKECNQYFTYNQMNINDCKTAQNIVEPTTPSSTTSTTSGGSSTTNSTSTTNTSTGDGSSTSTNNSTASGDSSTSSGSLGDSTTSNDSTNSTDSTTNTSGSSGDSTSTSGSSSSDSSTSGSGGSGTTSSSGDSSSSTSGGTGATNTTTGS
jgi:hypothetical protein